jgi:sirohydrochlorin cobaltochelatase
MVIGHGSKLPYNKETITFQANELKKMGYDNIFCAFNEFDEPFIEDVFDEMMLRRMEEIIVLPLFISSGAHLKNDIPRKIRLSDGVSEDTFVHDGRNVTVRYATPIGSDPRLTDIIADRVRGGAQA